MSAVGSVDHVANSPGAYQDSLPRFPLVSARGTNEIRVVLLIILASGWLPGLSFHSQAANQTEPAILPFVTLTAIANDSHGAPVLDLQSTELRVFDNNKEEKVTSFHVNGGHERKVTILVFDQLNMGLGAQARSASALLKFLQTANGEETANLAVYLISPKGILLPVQGVSDTRGGEAFQSNLLRGLQRDLRQTQRVESQLVLDEARRFEITAGVLQGLVSQLVNEEPGLKNVMWITGDISIDNVRPEARKLAAEFNQVNAPLYILDESQPQSAGAVMAKWLQNDLTSLTGGRELTGLDFKSALAKEQTDLRNTYEITYAPKLENWDDTYHSIHLVCRRPKTSLRFKQVYFASKPF